MHHKYGQEVRPWRGELTLSNTISGKDGQYDELHCEGSKWDYTYELTNTMKSEGLIEREPHRHVSVVTPNSYKGVKRTDESSWAFTY